MEFRNNLLSALDESDLKTLLPSLVEISIERGQVLLEPGDAVDFVIFPSTAVLSVVTVMLDGSSVESSTIGHESAAPILWTLASQPSKARIFAQIGGSAARLPAAALRARAEQSPALTSLLIRHAASIAFQAEQGVACNIVHEAAPRLARWILMTQDRTGHRTLPLTQEYMAVMTGVQRTTISTIANQLRSRGFITYSRGVVEIRNRAGLEAYACECYGAIRADFDDLRAS